MKPISPARIAIAALAAQFLVAEPGRGEAAIEIHPLCVSSGCFASDPAGFPITISEPGNYLLTGNLEVPGGVDAIRVTAPSASIDLGGHTISGPFTCETSTGCSGSAAGNGIALDLAGARDGLEIRNGVIRGMGGYAVNCDLGTCSVDSIRAVENVDGGIRLASLIGGHRVIDSVALRNGGTGITVVVGVLRDSSSLYNIGTGILAIATSVTNAVSRANTEGGLTITDGQVENSIAEGNGTSGFFCSNCAMIENYSNNNTENGAVMLGTTIAGGNRLINNGVANFNLPPTVISMPNICDGTTC